MTLVQEQTFVHLWWTNGGKTADEEPDSAVLGSASEAIRDWSRTASLGQRRLAFGARGCLRGHGGDCSWVSGFWDQMQAGAGGAPRIATDAALEWHGEPFAYPFMDSAAEPGTQRAHYPRLSDLQALCLAAERPRLQLRVIALHRQPLAALRRIAAEKPARFWRKDG